MEISTSALSWLYGSNPFCSSVIQTDKGSTIDNTTHFFNVPLHYEFEEIDTFEKRNEIILSNFKISLLLSVGF